MRSKTSNLRIVVYAILAIAICVAFLVLITSFGPERTEIPLLNFTAIVISVATLASIAFAVVTYMESTVLSKRVDDAKKEAKEQHQQALRELQSIRNIYFELAKISYKGLLETFMSLQPVSTYQKAAKELRMTLIDISLTHGTYEELLKAIQAAFKYNKRRFLDIEAEIWKKTEQMQDKEKQMVRNYYLALKRKVLDSLAIVAQQNK